MHAFDVTFGPAIMASAPTITTVQIYSGSRTLNGTMDPGSYSIKGNGDAGDTLRIFDADTGNAVHFPTPDPEVFVDGTWSQENGPGAGYPVGLTSYYAQDLTNGLRSPTVQFLVGTRSAETLTGPNLGATISGPRFVFGNGGADTFIAYTVTPDASGAHATGVTIHIGDAVGATVVLPIRLSALTGHAYRQTQPYTGYVPTLDTPDARVEYLYSSKLRFDDVTLTVQPGVLTDFLYYDQRYPDLAAADVNPWAHYDSYGWREGRDPNADFSTRGYLGAYGDVRNAGLNPLNHYDVNGWKEGRDPSAQFDTRLYLLFNPDVAKAGVDPLQHYLANGIGEGRKTSPVIARFLVRDGFDPLYYALANPDVSLSGMDARTHWLSFGAKEGRNPDSFFDTNFYLAHNPDVAAAGVNALDHYNQFGWREGRDPSSHFNTVAYQAAYADVAKAGMNPLQHFLQYGAAEGRSGFGNLY